MAVPFLDLIDITAPELFISSFDGTSTFGIYRRATSPEGAIAANPGSMCFVTAGVGGGELWLKQSGAGNTGWIQFTTSVNTNFANADLTANGPRVHSFASNSLTINNLSTYTTSASGTHTMTASDFKLTGSNVQITHSTASLGGILRLSEGTTNGAHYVDIKSPNAMNDNWSLTLPIAKPTAPNQALVADTDGNASWQTVTGSDTNFAANNLTATGNRTHDFAGNALAITNLDSVTTIATNTHGMTASEFVMTGDYVQINKSATAGGEIRFREASNNGVQYVAIKGPDSVDVANSWTLTLPAAKPTQAGMHLIADSNGIASWTTVSPGDANFRGVFVNLADLNNKASTNQPPFDTTPAGSGNYALLTNPGADATWAGYDNDLSTFVEIGELQTPTVNLGIANITPTTLDVTSNLGADATVPAVTITTAGLMIAVDKVKLDATGSYAQDYGDGVSLSYPITHNLGTRDVTIEVVENSGSRRRAFPTIEMTSTNAITILHSVAPLTNAYRVTINKVGAAV